jgi:hypothetical protein
MEREAMAELLIRYADSAGNTSERRISDIEPEDPGYIGAFCHERQEGRTFKVSRIVSAIDAETGEVIEDLYSYLGIEAPPKPPPPEPDPIPRTPAEIKRRRGRDKWLLFGPLVLGVIEEHFKRKFFALFGNACFKCGSPGPLVIDHHVPVVRGGRLVPGNLVALCKRCNDRKQDKPPEVFYKPEELERLHALLSRQDGIFDFKFDHGAFKADREGYLLSVGIDAETVRAVLNDPGHRHYIPPPDEIEERESVEVVIDMNTEEFREIIRKVMAEQAEK